MAGLLETVGIRQRDRSHHLAHLLSLSHRPVTLMFRDTFGIELGLVPVRAGHGRLDAGQAELVGWPQGKPCRWRTGRLVTAGGQLAAGVFLLWVPGRLPAAAAAELEAAAEPAGAILARLPGGMHRECLRAVACPRLCEITGEMSGAQSRAALVTRHGIAGYAEENWMREFAEGLP